MIRWYKKKVELRQWLKASHQIRMQRRKQLPAKSDKKKLLQMLEDYKNVKIQTAKQKMLPNKYFEDSQCFSENKEVET